MSDEGLWSSLVSIFIFLVAALLVITIVGKYLIGFQGSFESSICKFNAWMRSNTVGNPMFQALAGTSSFITGGIGGMTSSMTVPLVCTKAPQMSIPSNGHAEISDVVFKVSEELVNCWDQFGLGKWDPLILSNEGQSFSCFEQVIPINCTSTDLLNLWSERDSKITSLASSSVVNQGLLYYYLQTKSYSYAGFNKTYAGILNEGMPIIGDLGGFISCDGNQHSYYISISFIDHFSGGFPNMGVVSQACGQIIMTSQRSDSLFMCMFEYGG